MKNKKYAFCILPSALLWLALIAYGFTSARADEISFGSRQDTWANWNTRWETAFANVPSRKLPGRAMGIIVPSDTRSDILPLSAFGYEVLTHSSFHTVIILMQAPVDYPLEGLAVPGVGALETSFGRFPVDTALRDQIQVGTKAIVTDPNLFLAEIPQILQRQLAGLKFVLHKDWTTLKILPVYVKFTDVNSQAKDFAPFLVDRIRGSGTDDDVAFLIVGNLTRAPSEERLIQTDATILKAIRELDVDGMMNVKTQPTNTDIGNDDFSALALGVLTLRSMGADHAEISAYAHSGQLVLTKDKKTPLGYVSAGFASRPHLLARIPHVPQEKMTDIFGELLRSDMLALARQTCLSTLDPTAAKPPAINNPQAAKKWPIYVSIYDPQGKLAGQAGSHVATGPLEESLRQYTFEATRMAQPELSKSNAANHVIEISIPYGFENFSQPDDLIPLLNGVVVSAKLKTKALHPDAWRAYPDPHQLLSAICTKLGADPWAYATSSAHLESFRVFSFNEKEPFQDLGSSKKKKKKNKNEGFPEGGGTDGGNGGGGSGLFTF